jgi:hypothetical protein
VGPDHPRSRSLRNKLCALDTVPEKKTLINVSESVSKFRRETWHLGAEGKRHKLLKKLCKRQVLVSVALRRYLLCIRSAAAAPVLFGSGITINPEEHQNLALC